MNYRIIFKSLMEVIGRDSLTMFGMTVDRVYFIQQRSWKTLYIGGSVDERWHRLSHFKARMEGN